MDANWELHALPACTSVPPVAKQGLGLRLLCGHRQTHQGEARPAGAP